MRSISSPCRVQDTSAKLDLNVILVAKFRFTAESDHEITVNKGDVLKLLDRPGNGWLLVKFVDKLEKPGLVPATYVEIVLNDLLSPITADWLQDATAPNYPTLTLVHIDKCLLFNERYWYRVDLCYSNGSAKYLCKYYLDFYDLHATLQELSSTSPKLGTLHSSLPKLPTPIQFIPSRDITYNISRRCDELDTYINKLLRTAIVDNSDVFINWLDLSNKKNIGFSVKDVKKFNLSDYEISQNVQPNLTLIVHVDSPRLR